MVTTCTRPINQIGYVVENLDAAIRRRISTMGLGPWTIFRNVVLDGIYGGAPTRVTMDVGLAYQGDLQIELIAPTNLAASPYRSDDGTLRTGMHHLASIVDDLDATVKSAEAAGLKTLFHAGNAATKVAYLHDPDEPDVLYEYIEGVGMRAMVEAGIAAARDWDGSDPIQEIT